MEHFDIDVNHFPSLTWNFLGINSTRLGLDSECAALHIQDAKELEDTSLYSSIETGLGKEFDRAFDSLLHKNGIKTVRCAFSGQNSARKIEFSAEENSSCVCDVVIHAAENENLSYIFVYRSAAGIQNSQLGIRIRVCAEENSRVHISCVNLLGENVVHFSSLGSRCADNSVIEITELQLGSGKSFSGTFCSLDGYKSRFLGEAAYIAKGNSFLDMNQVAHQSGKCSESRFSVDGVLMDSAQKTWRGTIDFKKGCADSVGDEQEDVLLLSPRTVNKSLPVILCDEEAVEGRHGCSIGKIDTEKLFYMQSRGIDEATVRSLLARAKVSKVCRFIPDESLVEEINEFVEKSVR
ncbi:SufB/SufD family protein [Treponema sp.]|uniref:SufB/SufD family protein n=1 Tax=Treponema sp. TaxID=166 RepID=UPI003F03DCAF